MREIRQNKGIEGITDMKTGKLLNRKSALENSKEARLSKLKDQDITTNAVAYLKISFNVSNESNSCLKNSYSALEESDKNTLMINDEILTEHLAENINDDIFRSLVQAYSQRLYKFAFYQVHSEQDA